MLFNIRLQIIYEISLEIAQKAYFIEHNFEYLYNLCMEF